MAKVKILYTLPNFTTAGSGREMVNILERLDKSLFEPSVCIQKEGGSLEQELIRKGYTVIVYPFNAEGKTWINALLVVIRLGIRFRRYGFKLWHSFHWSSDFTEALVALLAGATFLYTKKNMNWSRRAWRVKTKLAHFVIARNTSMSKRFFDRRSFQRKVAFIPGGVDETKFYKRPADPGFRKRYALESDTFVIISVAQLIPIKGQHLILQALNGLHNTVVFFAGVARDAVYAESLKAMAKELKVLNSTFFLNEVADVPGLLNEGDLFVLATTLENEHEEGCPVSVLEAMACRLPCLVSNVAGSNDLIHHGVNGFLFEPGNSQDLREHILKIRENKELAEKLSIQAAKDVSSKYTLEIEAKRFQAVYTRLIEGV